MWIVVVIILFIIIWIVTAIFEAIEKKKQAIRNQVAKDLLKDFNYQKEKNKILAITQSFTIKDYRCPACGHTLVLRRGKFGQFWGCSTYPKCHFTRNKI